MNDIQRKTAASFFVNGALFSGCMSAFSLASGDPISWLEITLQFILFGGLMAFYVHKKLKKNEKS